MKSVVAPVDGLELRDAIGDDILDECRLFGAGWPNDHALVEGEGEVGIRSALLDLVFEPPSVGATLLLKRIPPLDRVFQPRTIGRNSVGAAPVVLATDHRARDDKQTGEETNLKPTMVHDWRKISGDE